MTMNADSLPWKEYSADQELVAVVIDVNGNGNEQNIGLIESAAKKGFELASAVIREAKVPFTLKVVKSPIIDHNEIRDFEGKYFPAVSLIRVNGPEPVESDTESGLSAALLSSVDPSLHVVVFRDFFLSLMRSRLRFRQQEVFYYRHLRHQVGNLVFRVSARLDQVRTDVSENDMEKRLERTLDLVGGAQRATLAFQSLLMNMGTLAGDALEVAPSRTVSSVLVALQHMQEKAREWGVGVDIQGELRGDGPADSKLVHAICEILESSLRAQLGNPGGRVIVRQGMVGPAGYSVLKLEIADQRGDLVSPFNGGAGGIASYEHIVGAEKSLGFKASSTILQAYGGRLSFRPRPEGGAEFLLELPLPS